ncbi:MAG: hypothetical protein R3F23_04290 [Verrucomicrobiia bacterium]
MSLVTPQTNEKIINIFSILCGLWFVATSWVWYYGATIFYSYPVGILGISLWYLARKINRKSILNRIAFWLHIAGLTSSIISFCLFYFGIWG